MIKEILAGRMTMVEEFVKKLYMQITHSARADWGLKLRGTPKKLLKTTKTRGSHLPTKKSIKAARHQNHKKNVYKKNLQNL